jgi:hypothetical protein
MRATRSSRCGLPARSEPVPLVAGDAVEVGRFALVRQQQSDAPTPRRLGRRAFGFVPPVEVTVPVVGLAAHQLRPRSRRSMTRDASSSSPVN